MCVGGVPSKTFDFLFLISDIRVIYQAIPVPVPVPKAGDLTSGAGCVIVGGLVKATGRSHNKGVALCR